VSNARLGAIERVSIAGQRQEQRADQRNGRQPLSNDRGHAQRSKGSSKGPALLAALISHPQNRQVG
jgi:hypothetical protein